MMLISRRRAGLPRRAVDRGNRMALAPRRTIWPVVLALLALAVGCRQANQLVLPPPPQVTVAQPVERPVNDTIEFVATTQPTQTVDLRSQVKGYLEKILFEDGSNVKAGDLLFVIEQAPYKLALNAAKAALQKAVASQSLAESQYRRMEPLLKDGVVTQEELDVQAAQVATSKADVASAQTAVESAQLNLSYTQIHSPINGRIGQHMVDIGNLVQAQETLLANIQTIDPIYAQFDLSENDLLRFMEMLRKNELPDPERTPPTLHLGLPNEEGFPHEGKLDFRELRIDPSTGTARRRGIFPNPGWQLIPGMFVKISASVGGPVPRLLVEERAIGTDQRGDYVLAVNDKNVVEYRTIRLGIHVGGLRVIEDGISKADWLVVNGLQRARPGATIAPERTQMKAPSAIKVEQSAESIGSATAPAQEKAVPANPNTKAAAAEKTTTSPPAKPANNAETASKIAPPVKSNAAPPKANSDVKPKSDAAPAKNSPAK
jgi:RND family efflux transporter MFP subunit